jgi:hypothetical protein
MANVTQLMNLLTWLQRHLLLIFNRYFDHPAWEKPKYHG